LVNVGGTFVGLGAAGSSAKAIALIAAKKIESPKLANRIVFLKVLCLDRPIMHSCTEFFRPVFSVLNHFEQRLCAIKCSMHVVQHHA
jgi:hypothetical protein